MKLNEREIAVMRYLEMRGKATAAEIAKATRLRVHTVHYTVAKLFERRVLRRRVMINPYRLGLTRLAVFLALPGMSKSEHASFLSALRRSPHVALVLELGGAFHYEINLLGHDTAALREELDWLVECSNVPWIAKSIALLVEHTVYGSKALGGRPLSLPPFGYRADSEAITIDHLDHGLLQALMSEERASLREIARKLAIPASTAEFRVQRLEAQKVITGYTYLLEGTGLLHYVVLVHMRTVGRDQRRKLADFARAHPAVFYTTENIGNWDFELGLVVREPREVTRAVQDLHEAMAGDLSRTESLSLIERHKVMDYPLERVPR